MQRGAVDEVDPVQVENDDGRVPHELVETRLDLACVRQIQLSGDLDEPDAGIRVRARFQLERRHGGRAA